jgi:hypothetical protein
MDCFAALAMTKEGGREAGAKRRIPEWHRHRPPFFKELRNEKRHRPESPGGGFVNPWERLATYDTASLAWVIGACSA